MCAPRLGALLDRVSPLCGDGSLARLDPSDLVDADRSLWRVLYVDVHQRRVERHCEQMEAEFRQPSREFIVLHLKMDGGNLSCEVKDQCSYFSL